MKMTIARALKEKKRLVGEMNTARQKINNANVVCVNVRADKDGGFRLPTKDEINARRSRICPAELMGKWYEMRDRLVALKAALHSANSGVAAKLAMLSELKAELHEVESMSGAVNEVETVGDYQRVVDVAFDNGWRISRMDELRREINDLQDSVDEYNATH